MYQERKRRQTETRGDGIYKVPAASEEWLCLLTSAVSPLGSRYYLSILDRQTTHHTVKSGPDTESPTLEWLDIILIRRAVTLVCVVIIPFHAEAQLQFYRIFNKC